MSNDLTLIQSMVLDELAAGKTPREIATLVGVTPAEAAKMAYDLLDREIVTDADSRRKLQVYRLEKIVSALWQRVQDHAERDDVKNLLLVLEQLNELLALNKEHDDGLARRMEQHQLAVYMSALLGLITAFKALAPNLMTEAEWGTFTVERLESAKSQMMLEIEQ